MKADDWEKVETVEEATKYAVDVLKSVGMSGGVFSYTPIGRLPSGIPGLLKRAIPLNVDPKVIKEWMEYQNDLEGRTRAALSQSHDPVRRRMIAQIVPEHFVMQELLESRRLARNAASVKWIKTLMDFGIRESYSIPIFSGRGEYWSMAAVRYFDNPNTQELSSKTLGELYWFTAKFADFCANKLNWRSYLPQDVKRPLSPRELDCLYWAAQGKTSNETAEMLQLQIGTVRKYIKMATAKLNANSKTQAVCIAHQLGYLAIA